MESGRGVWSRSLICWSLNDLESNDFYKLFCEDFVDF